MSDIFLLLVICPVFAFEFILLAKFVSILPPLVLLTIEPPVVTFHAIRPPLLLLDILSHPELALI